MPSVQASPSLRDRKKSATRNALHEAALSLTEERGLAAVTVDAIAERADVAARTFFNYYPSKVHAVVGRDPDRPGRLQRALEERPLDEAPLVALRQVLVEDLLGRQSTVEQLLRRYRVLWGEPVLVAMMAAEFEELERGMSMAVAHRTGRQAGADLYPALVVAAALGAMRVAIMEWCDEGGGEPLEAVVDEAFDQLTRGFGP